MSSEPVGLLFQRSHFNLSKSKIAPTFPKPSIQHNAPLEEDEVPDMPAFTSLTKMDERQAAAAAKPQLTGEKSQVDQALSYKRLIHSILNQSLLHCQVFLFIYVALVRPCQS